MILSLIIKTLFPLPKQMIGILNWGRTGEGRTYGMTGHRWDTTKKNKEQKNFYTEFSESCFVSKFTKTLAF